MFPSASLSSWVVARLMAPLMKAAAPLALPAFAMSPATSLSPPRPARLLLSAQASPPCPLPASGQPSWAMHIHAEEAAPSSEGLVSWAFINHCLQLSPGYQHKSPQRRAAMSPSTMGSAEWKRTINTPLMRGLLGGGPVARALREGIGILPLPRRVVWLSMRLLSLGARTALDHSTATAGVLPRVLPGTGLG